MAITASDIKLLESERMRDTSDGGGRMTVNVIPSGVAGNVFPKVSRVDAVYGRVNLRKIYAAVRTATLDTYAGAHAVITDAPDNAKIGCVLFSTASAFDTRTGARDRIESYVVAGPASRMRLYGNQIIGQKAITCYQRVEEPLPDVGDVYVLSVEASGFTPATQYVRVTDVTHEVREFSELFGSLVNFSRRVVTLKIGSALVQTFQGAEPTQLIDPSPTKVRNTQVADASRYYGIQPLVAPVTSGSLDLLLASVYAPLVPSAQRESAISLGEISGAQALVAASTATHQVTTSINGVNGAVSLQLLRAVVPGTFSGSWGSNNFNNAATSVTDNGQGVLTFTNTTYYSAGKIDYVSGLVTFTIAGLFNLTNMVLTAKPAVQTGNPAHTHEIPITLATRGTVYSETLNPLPAPGTVIVDYRALGKWYRFRDDGTGVLVANDPSEGTGSVDYATGAVIVTLGALPDVDSSLLIAWGSPVHFTVRAGATTDAGTTLGMRFSLVQTPVVAGSVVITYPVGGSNRTATDSAGVISGTGVSGTINYASGEIVLAFSTPPDRASLLSIDYSYKDAAGQVSTGSPTLSGGVFTVPGTAPFENSGAFSFLVTAPPSMSTATFTVSAYIASDGSVKVQAGQQEEYKWVEQSVGTFNTANGEVTIASAITIVRNLWLGTGSWSTFNYQQSITAVLGLSVERNAASGTTAVVAEQVDVDVVGLTIDLTATVSDSIVAGSLLFTLCGKTYIDRNGTLYADVSSITGAGTTAGTIDYTTGIARLTYWADNAAVARTVLACMTLFGEWTAVDAVFRTAGSPLRPASVYVQATTIDGDLISATADVNGVISGPYITGVVNQTMGVVSLQFGNDPGGGFVEREIMPSTLRYNAVVITDLPLDPGILGLDPVRLPADGRVPIYRPGDVVVVHNTQTTALTNPVVASTTYSVGRTDLAIITLQDANGAAIADDRYTVDLALGEVTMAADWDGTGVAQPLVARHRIEDMSLVTDVQVNGGLSVSATLTHDYPADTSFVSSALLFGDLQAIVTGVFDQQTWTSVWSDALIGSQATAQYNDVGFPIEVLNDGAVTERWRINFTSSTAFQIIGENLGVIGTGTTSADAAPVNPITGDTYFVIRAAGWGAGWATGNNLRFNTIGANAPIWIARTVLAGASLEGDSFDLEARGDVDA